MKELVAVVVDGGSLAAKFLNFDGFSVRLDPKSVHKVRLSVSHIHGRQNLSTPVHFDGEIPRFESAPQDFFFPSRFE